MIPVLAFRIQEKVYGGLDAGVMACLRSLIPKCRVHTEARRRLKPGTRLVREWKGKIHEVILTDNGYDYSAQSKAECNPIAEEQ